MREEFRYTSLRLIGNSLSTARNAGGDGSPPVSTRICAPPEFIDGKNSSDGCDILTLVSTGVPTLLSQIMRSDSTDLICTLVRGGLGDAHKQFSEKRFGGSQAAHSKMRFLSTQRPLRHRGSEWSRRMLNAVSPA